MAAGAVTDSFHKKRIFISYGPDELAEIAMQLKVDLAARGHEVWPEESHIKPGSDREQYIEDGLDWASKNDSGRMILLMTPHSVRRPDGYCLNELSLTIQKYIKVIPVMMTWCEPPLSICRIQWLDMRDCMPLSGRFERYRAKFQRLVEAIEHDKLDFEGFQSYLFNSLKPLSFEADIRYNLDRFTGREWVVEAIDRWLASGRSRIFWITGSPGVGKTALAAWLCAHRPEIVAFHFCRFDNVQKIDPRRCIMSIAYQLSTQLPEYEQKLKVLDMDEFNDLNAKALFDHMIVQPLSGIEEPGRPMVMLIDALDEATAEGKNELAGFISTEFERTPAWLRLVVTSRPDPEVTGPLQAYRPFVIDISDSRNESDIRTFFRQELKEFNHGKELPGQAIEAIVKKSDGLFLYAEWIIRELMNGRLSIGRIDEFPQGLGGIYLKFFDRQFPDMRDWESGIRPALEVLVALLEPVDLKALSRLMGWNVHEERKFRRSLGSLYQFDGQVRPFHKSLLEWLTNEDKEDQYYISVLEGHRALAAYGMKLYHTGEESWPRYLVMYLPDHLHLVGNTTALREIMGDLRFIRKAWEKDRFNLMRQWTFFEEQTPLRMKDVYCTFLNSPEKADVMDLLALAYLMKSTFHYDEALQILGYLKNYYESNGDLKGTQETLGNLAMILIDRSNFHEAMPLLKEKERICRETNNLSGLQYSLLYQAKILHFTNDFEQSLALLREQEAICREIGNMDGLQNSLTYQSLIQRVRGDLPGAMALSIEQEKICREIGNIDGLLLALTDQGLILRMMGMLDKAIELFKEQEALSRQIGNKEMLQTSLYAHAMVLRLTGDLDLALALLDESEAICRKLDYKFSLGEIFGERALILRMKGRLDEALALLNERKRISRDLGDRWGLQFAFGNEAVILRLKGDLEGAQALHRAEERICREIGHKRDLAMSLHNQAILRRIKGDLDGALSLHRESEKALREIGYRYGLQEALGEQAMTLFEKGDHDVALALLGEQEAICKDMGLKIDLRKCNDNQITVLTAKAGQMKKEKEMLSRGK